MTFALSIKQARATLNDGRRMPQLALGVRDAPVELAAKVVRTAIEAGYQSVDTAAAYQNEAGVGRALRETGAALFVTAKLWNDQHGYDQTLRAFETSLRRLGRDQIDLYLIHWPSPGRGLYVESWRALVRLRNEGRAKSIGVSNFNQEHLEELIRTTGVIPAVNQIELHPRFQQKRLRGFHARHGIVTQSSSPLGLGRALDQPVLVQIGRKHRRTPAQIVLRWHLDNGLIAIPKSVTPARIHQNVDVFDFALDADDIARIDALDDVRGRLGPDPANTDF
jgi:2,5-diketo-D-gluconate reductase A